ncbi:MAG: hypothetical protein C4522_03065 [Desulfobacteraceae bacterium]|nr:MAG: hypothetical protein C4522_03065 [Desulfobacteraceae bacterium]
MKTNTNLKKIILAIFTILLIPGISFATATTSVEGTIEGANCIIAKDVCPKTNGDPHVALEPDFVLSASGGDYYFLPNVSRWVKTSYINKPIRITGKVRDHAIFVTKIEVKSNDAYYNVWDWNDITRKMSKR